MFVCWLDDVMEREKLMIQEKEGTIDGVISNHSNGKMRGLFYYFSIKYDVHSSAQSLWKGKFEQKMKVKKRVLIEIGELNRLEVSIRMYEIETSEVVQGTYGPLYESDYILPKIYVLWEPDLYFSHYCIQEKHIAVVQLIFKWRNIKMAHKI